MASMRDALWSALDAAIALATRPDVAAAWDEPSALEGLTVGGLVAHVLVATERTALLLEAEAPSAADFRLVTIPEFYGPNRIDDDADLAEGLPALLRQGASARADQGQAVVLAELSALPARLRAVVDGAGDDRLVPVITVRDGAARLDDYLVTRVIELVVHTDDLACSIGLAAPEIPPAVFALVASAFLELAVARSGSAAVIRAFARRERADADVLRVL